MYNNNNNIDNNNNNNGDNNNNNDNNFNFNNFNSMGMAIKRSDNKNGKRSKLAQRVVEEDNNNLDFEANKQIGEDGYASYKWDETGAYFHPVPKGWRIPKITPQALYRLWVRGDPAFNIKPYRFIKGDDLSASTDKVVLSKIRYVMVNISQLMGRVVAKDGTTSHDFQPLILVITLAK